MPNTPRFTEQDDAVLRAQYGEICNRQIGLMLSPQRSAESVKKRAARLGVTGRLRTSWSDVEDQQLVSMLALPRAQIAQMLSGRTVKAIQSRVHILGLSGPKGHRRYNIDHDYFSRDTPQSSYWAGFIAADGCIQHHDPELHQVKVAIQVRDACHLYTLAGHVGHDGEVKIRRCHVPGWSDIALLRVHSKRMVHTLEQRFNITPRKALTLQPPPLDTLNDAAPFIIGYIDGDGSIFVDRTMNRLAISAAGTYEMLSWIKGWFDELAPPPSKGKASKAASCVRPHQSIHQYVVRGWRATAIAHVLGSYDVPLLQRKWDVAFRFGAAA